ncbi:MAG TPA: class I SAM-dependent methyltransferase [Anaerolineales bacterium]|nr:class I SAM-dependent methyltransferase [Anaerolineales bacterium]
MLYENSVSESYLHGNLLNAIQTSLGKLGKTTDTVTVEDLGPADEFHIGGRLATKSFLDQLNFSKKDHILDVGCGLGGAARFVADQYGSSVTGIDLSQEYTDTGKALSNWVKLGKQITLQQGSALSMPFEDNTFDGGYMLHVGMNIEDKAKLFAEISRVLKPGATFGVYDIMRFKEGELTYPVPWATVNGTNKLATLDQYKSALIAAGFEVSKVNNRRDFALDFFKQMRAKNEANGGPPPLGLHTLMKESTPAKLKNMVDSIAADYIAPVEIIAQKG